MPVWRRRGLAAQWRDPSAQQVAQNGRPHRRAVGLAIRRDRGARGFEVHMALTVRSGLVWLTLPLPRPSRPEFPDVVGDLPGRQTACSAPRSTCSACAPPARRTTGNGCGTRPGRRTRSRCARASTRRTTHPQRAGQLPVRAGGRRWRARDPGRAGARRHHRAGSLPLLRRRRARAAPGGAARLHAQGHREALRVA